ncbi:MAG: hypothetical protein ABC596_05905 [Candidatus Methanosuratincola petrocarbonis]
MKLLGKIRKEQVREGATFRFGDVAVSIDEEEPLLVLAWRERGEDIWVSWDEDSQGNLEIWLEEER